MKIIRLRAVIPIAHRFWLRVWPKGDCWEYRGAKTAAGYGKFHDGYRTLLAHRYAFSEAKGDIPEGLQIDHICQHKWCVRPTHLQAVTPKENVRRNIVFNGHKNSRKTHCIHGHPFSPKNVRRDKQGRRICRICKAAAEHKPHAESVAKRLLENVRRWTVDPLKHKRRKSHCPYGHEYDMKNSYITPHGSRSCRKCNVRKQQEYQKRRGIR